MSRKKLVIEIEFDSFSELGALSSGIKKAVTLNGGPYGDMKIGNAVAIYHLEYIDKRDTFEKDGLLCVKSRVK